MEKFKKNDFEKAILLSPDRYLFFFIRNEELVFHRFTLGSDADAAVRLKFPTKFAATG